jgi:hypothetical protein
MSQQIEQAIQVLSNATEPQVIGRLNRADYVNINNALIFLAQIGKEYDQLKEQVAKYEEAQKAIPTVIEKEKKP